MTTDKCCNCCLYQIIWVEHSKAGNGSVPEICSVASLCMHMVLNIGLALQLDNTNALHI